jgi:hypothetical protein
MAYLNKFMSRYTNQAARFNTERKGMASKLAHQILNKGDMSPSAKPWPSDLKDPPSEDQMEHF